MRKERRKPNPKVPVHCTVCDFGGYGIYMCIITGHSHFELENAIRTYVHDRVIK